MADWHQTIKYGMLTETHPKTTASDGCSIDTVRAQYAHAETVRALEATEHYERMKRLRQFVQDQWQRIPPVVHAQPGSYDRGYQNGMADILRGLEEIIWTAKV